MIMKNADAMRIGAVWHIYLHNDDGEGKPGELVAYDRVENMWATEGLAEFLNALRLTTPTSASAVGLIGQAGFTARSLSDTLASHAGWPEFTGYTGGRKVPSWLAATGRTISATGLIFPITSTASLRGAFLALGVSGTANKLGSTVALETPLAVTAGQYLVIDVTVSLPTPSSSTAILTNAGANYVLDRVFRSAGVAPALRMGFISASPTLAATDNFGSHAGWTEYTAYDETLRPGLSFSEAVGGTLSQSGSSSITPSSGAPAIGGFFITTNITKGNEGSGFLIATRRFSSNQAVTAAEVRSVANATLTLANFFLPPVASFSYTPTSNIIPFTITCTDTSSRNPTAWAWTVTDGTTTLTSTLQNPTFSITVAGTYTVSLVSTNDEGSSASYSHPTPLIADGVVSFRVLTTLKSDTAGEHWVSPFGIPIPWDQPVIPARFGKFVARYPAGPGGTLYEIQTEQFKRRELDDGFLQHCTGHVKLPASYAAKAIVEIGFSDTFTRAGTTNWTPIFASGDTTAVELDIYEPRVTMFCPTEPISGDVATLTISDGLGADLVYTHKYLTAGRFYRYRMDTYEANTGGQQFYELARKITQDPSGRYACYGMEVAKTWPWEYPNPEPPDRAGDRAYNAGWTFHHAPFSNSIIAHQMGVSLGYVNQSSGWSTVGAYQDLDKTQQWPAMSMPIWSRAGVTPTNYTVTVAIQRNGSRIAVTGSTLGNGYYRLAYNTKTTPFSGEGYVVGLTSGTRAWHAVDPTAGATGTLYVHRITGPGFQIGEIIESRTNTDLVQTGRATVAALATQQTLTFTGGATAKFEAAYDPDSSGNHTIHVTNITGTISAGQTITGDFGTATVVSAPVGSTFSFYNTYNTTAQTGAITPINDAVAPQLYSASFNASTDTPDSPWFNGNLIRQLEKRQAFVRVSDGQPHEHLELWTRVSKDKDGNVVHREAVVENHKMRAKVRDYWYNARVFVNSVNQTLGDSRYVGLFHSQWCNWRWKQAKPWGMCDPGDFMKSRIIKPWLRMPSWQPFNIIKQKLIGQQTSSGINFGWDPTPVEHAPPVRTTVNDPLYPGAFAFHAGPGHRPELGDFNTIEWAFWASDVFNSWPAMEALADNCMTAYGAYPRHEQGVGDSQWNPPDVYAEGEWQMQPHGFGVDGTVNSGAPGGGYTVPAPLKQKYCLRVPITPAPSHSCSTGFMSAYVVQPEKRFFDSCRQWTWWQTQNGPSQNRMNAPKIGEAAGGPNHRQGFSISNGIRTMSRPMRDAMYAAFISFEGSRQRATWRRMAGDYAYWCNEIAKKTMHGTIGIMGNHISMGSNNATDIYPCLVGGTRIRHPTYVADTTYYSLNDANMNAFPQIFVQHAAWVGRNLGIDTREFLARNNWQIHLLNNVPHGNWWNGYIHSTAKSVFNVGKFITVGTNSLGRYPAMIHTDAYPQALPDNELMNENRAAVEAITDPAAKEYHNVYDTIEAWSPSVEAGSASAGYTWPKLAYGTVLAYSLYGGDATLRSNAVTHLGVFDAAFPASGGSAYGYNRAQYWQQTGFVKYEDVANWS
jgi:PKD repeat protein